MTGMERNGLINLLPIQRKRLKELRSSTAKTRSLFIRLSRYDERISPAVEDEERRVLE